MTDAFKSPIILHAADALRRALNFPSAQRGTTFANWRVDCETFIEIERAHAPISKASREPQQAPKACI